MDTQAQFAIPILDDRVPEPDEALLMVLSDACAPNRLIRPAAPATLTIADCDVALYLALVRWCAEKNNMDIPQLITRSTAMPQARTRVRTR
ncbi:MAG: hypothetical protein ABIV47_20390 [Roseiflexaceae bacterium]